MQPMTIADAPVTTPDGLEVLNPATGEVVGVSPRATAQDVDRAMTAAQKAFGAWCRDEQARREALTAGAAVLRQNAGELGALLTAEQGKPLSNSALEIEFAAQSFDYYASLDVSSQTLLDSEKVRVELRRVPLGVAIGITPWNFPLSLAAQKISPALLAGNTMILKPSPYTPLSTLRMVELLAEVLPAGVLSALAGDSDLGPLLTKHPVPRKLSFTGSVATGRKIAEAGLADFKRVTLELGGNDAAIVLRDTDLSRAAIRIFWGAFINNGQTCSAIKRVYVHESQQDALLTALATIASKTSVGDPTLESTLLGPINNRPQLERVAGLVDQAVHGGARVVTGGSPIEGPGYFYAPTILGGVSDDDAIVTEEQFGPVLPVLTYSDEEDALRRANDSVYGLGGSVWGPDPEQAASLAARLECGVSWVNTHVALEAWQPFGGVKSSGVGSESGVPGYEAFTDLQTLRVQKR